MQFLILYLLFFSLPFQIRWGFVAGADEYQSAFLYLTDIAIGILFFFWIAKEKNIRLLSPYRFLLLPAGGFLLWLFLAGVFSDNPLRGFYGALKIAEFLWLFFYVLSLSLPTFRNALKALVGGGVFQSIIAVIQFFAQGSVGLSFLGENQLSPDLPGVAKIMVAGEQFIRAYGTFPHPNVLSVFFLFCLFALLFLSLHEKQSSLMRYGSFVAYPLLVLGFFLTFSRVALFFGTLALFSWALLFWRERLMVYLTILIGSLLIFAILLFPYFQSRLSVNFRDQAVSLRVFYTKTAFEAIREHPIVGVGLGQFSAFQKPFVEEGGLPEWANQPVHNMYILLTAEAGVPALFFFFWFLFNMAQFSLTARHRIAVIRESLFLFAIFMIASFDHFFLTFQQGGLIFWLSLAFFVYVARLDKMFFPAYENRR